MSPRLIFVGAPGSGKTTIGKKVAEKLTLQFIDVDSEIEMDEKITISETSLSCLQEVKRIDLD